MVHFRLYAIYKGSKLKNHKVKWQDHSFAPVMKVLYRWWKRSAFRTQKFHVPKWPNNITEQGKWHGLRTSKKESNGYIQTYERSNMLRAYESQRGMPIENDRQPPFLYGKCIFPSSISIDAHSQFRLHISQCDYIIETESLLSLSLSLVVFCYSFSQLRAPQTHKTPGLSGPFFRAMTLSK